MALNWFKKKGKSSDAQNEKDARDSKTAVSDKADPIFADAATDAHSTDLPATGNEQCHTNKSDSSLRDESASASQKRGGLMKHLKAGLAKTRQILTTDFDALFSNKKKIDDDMLEDLEELLITADIGVKTAMDLMKTITQKASKIDNPQALKLILKQELMSLLEDISTQPAAKTGKPHVVMVVGVNGVGKTTTIGKLAAKAARSGERVLIAAADTFRAAAIEQLSVWAERSGAEIVKHKANADPAAVVFDSIEAAIAREVDTVFVDTAGRLHTKVNLMEELKKIKRTITKKMPDAPHEVLLVLDATTGQNALSQAKLFYKDIGVSGLALTKLDGTAKGGIVISISQELNIPLQYIGVGEGIEDLQPFDPAKFTDALF